MDNLKVGQVVEFYCNEIDSQNDRFFTGEIVEKITFGYKVKCNALGVTIVDKFNIRNVLR